MLTLGLLKARIGRESRENIDDQILTDRANDAIESLWESVLLVNVQSFMQGPIQNVVWAAGSERETLVSIVDPSVALVPTVVAGGALAFPRTLYFAYTYVTESGSETNIFPLSPGPYTNITVAVANQLVSVPPPPLPALNPVGAIGWNLYASDNAGGRLSLQNSTPIDFAFSWQEPPTGIIDDPDLPAPPQSNSTADNIFYIKVLEMQNQDLTWTRWEGGSIDGLMFQRAGRNLPVASTYESYAWDVLRGNTIEIRPQAGMTLNPRYFYVAKPRRMRFDNSIIPFQNFAAEEFLVNYSLARIKLGTEDWEVSDKWDALAERKRTQTLEALSDQGVARQMRIVPYMYW